MKKLDILVKNKPAEKMMLMLKKKGLIKSLRKNRWVAQEAVLKRNNLII